MDQRHQKTCQSTVDDKARQGSTDSPSHRIYIYINIYKYIIKPFQYRNPGLWGSPILGNPTCQSQALAFVNDVPWILSFTASRCKFNGMQSHCKSQSSRATLAFSFQLQKCVYFLQLSGAFCSSGTCSWKGH